MDPVIAVSTREEASAIVIAQTVIFVFAVLRLPEFLRRPVIAVYEH